MKDFKDLTTDEQLRAIIKNPDLAKDYDWSKLSGDAWDWLLREREQFAEHYDWTNLDGNDLYWLLRKQPQFAKYCDWSLLPEELLEDLLQRNPQLVEQCYKPKVTESTDRKITFDFGDWGSLYQDRAGTIPVTEDGQFVLSVRGTEGLVLSVTKEGPTVNAKQFKEEKGISFYSAGYPPLEVVLPSDMGGTTITLDVSKHARLYKSLILSISKTNVITQQLTTVL